MSIFKTYLMPAYTGELVCTYINCIAGVIHRVSVFYSKTGEFKGYEDEIYKQLKQ